MALARLIDCVMRIVGLIDRVSSNCFCPGNDKYSEFVTVHAEAVELWNKLSSIGSLLEIRGPPGMGKSSEVWAWACVQSRKVLWLHLNAELPIQYVVMDKSNATHGILDPLGIKNLLKQTQPIVVIVDGIFKDEKYGYAGVVSAVRFWQATKGEHVELFVLSNAADSRLQVLYVKEKRGEGLATMDPWLLEECKAAASDFQFAKSVIDFFDCSDAEKSSFIAADAQEKWPQKVEWMRKLVEDKWDIAGASARWMFNRTPEKVRSDVAQALTYVSSLSDLLKKDMGDASSTAKNHLLMSFPVESKCRPNERNAFFVSRYVARLVLERDRGKNVSIAYDLGLKHKNLNPAFLGWVTEFEIHHHLEQGRKLELSEVKQGAKVSVMPNISFENPGVVEFDVNAKSPIDPIRKEFVAGFWLRPKKWNQSGYDLVRWDNSIQCLDFFQVTRGDSHEYWSSHFKSLINKIKDPEIKRVRIFFVFPSIAGLPLSIPRIVVSLSGALKKLHVGSSDNLWETDDQKYITLCSFSTCCTAAQRNALNGDFSID